jgi:hypothetical protein
MITSYILMTYSKSLALESGQPATFDLIHVFKHCQTLKILNAVTKAVNKYVKNDQLEAEQQSILILCRKGL